MLQAISEIMGMQVYTPAGMYIGNVDNLVMDMENRRVNGIFVSDTNPLLVEDSRSINIPFRWVQSVGDVVILRYFPDRIASPRQEITQM